MQVFPTVKRVWSLAFFNRKGCQQHDPLVAAACHHPTLACCLFFILAVQTPLNWRNVTPSSASCSSIDVIYGVFHLIHGPHHTARPRAAPQFSTAFGSAFPSGREKKKKKSSWFFRFEMAGGAGRRGKTPIGNPFSRP